MKFIYPKVEIITQDLGKDGIYKKIETAARVCYKSEGSLGKEFVDRLIQNKHMAMLEHGTVYLTIMIANPFNDPNYTTNFRIIHTLISNPYTEYKRISYDILEDSPEFVKSYIENYGSTRVYYITTNLRVLYDNFDDPESIIDSFLDDPSEHPKRISVKITCDRINSQSFMRHRKFSFAQESTRYCNYSKDKFGKEITYIIPTWITNFEEYVENYGLPCEGVIIRPPIDDFYLMSLYNFFYSLFYAEENYMRLLDLGRTPQEARQVLPNALKTEFIMTGFEDDWKQFLDVRTTNKYGTPHPDMKNIALDIKDLLGL